MNLLPLHVWCATMRNAGHERVEFEYTYPWIWQRDTVRSCLLWPAYRIPDPIKVQLEALAEMVSGMATRGTMYLNVTDATVWFRVQVCSTWAKLQKDLPPQPLPVTLP